MEKPPPYQSVLQRFPEHAKAIGLTSVEIANLDIFLGYLFAAVLKLAPHVGRDIYLTPKSAFARLELLESAIDSMMEPKSSGAKHLRSLLGRAKRIVEDRHGMIHDSWGTNAAGDVVRRPLRAGGEGTPVPLKRLEQMLLDIRNLIGDAQTAALDLQQAAAKPGK